MPFETDINDNHSEESESEKTHYPKNTENSDVKELTPEHLSAGNLEQIAVVKKEESASVNESEESSEIQEITVKKPDTIPRIVPISDRDENNFSDTENVIGELQLKIDSNEANISIPEEWRIDAEEINMEEIYASEDEVVEFVHGFEEDIVVFQHEQTKPNDIISSATNGFTFAGITPSKSNGRRYLKAPRMS